MRHIKIGSLTLLAGAPGWNRKRKWGASHRTGYGPASGVQDGSETGAGSSERGFKKSTPALRRLRRWLIRFCKASRKMKI